MKHAVPPAPKSTSMPCGTISGPSAAGPANTANCWRWSRPTPTATAPPASPGPAGGRGRLFRRRPGRGGGELRRAGIERPILVLGGVDPGQEEDAAGARSDPRPLRPGRRPPPDGCRDRRPARCRFHLKLDTGMGRLGFRPAGARPAFCAELSALPGLEMEGVISHLALADEPDIPSPTSRCAASGACSAMIRAAGFAPTQFISATAPPSSPASCPSATWCARGSLSTAACRPEHFAGRLDLRPVMSLVTTIAQLKPVPAGTGISYGHRFVASRPSPDRRLPRRLRRRLSTAAFPAAARSLVRGRRARIAGTVCMDWTMFDVTDIPGVAARRPGDPARQRRRQSGQRRRVGRAHRHHQLRGLLPGRQAGAAHL